MSNLGWAYSIPRIIEVQREEIIKSLIAHAEGQIAKHKANVEIFLNNAVGVGEHNDVLETIEKEINSIGKYQEQIEMLKKYF